MATIRFGESDRDKDGFIRLSPPAPAEDVTDAPPPIAPPVRPAAPARPPLSPRLRYQLTIAAAAVVGVLLILLSTRLSAPRAMTNPSTPIPTSAATTAAQPSATPPLPPVEKFYGYWAPDNTSGSIEIDRAKIDHIEELRAPWARVAMDGGGLVWTSIDVLPPAVLAAYKTPTPRPTAPPPAATATPEPPPCASAGVPGKMVEVCGWGDLATEAKAKWIATYGGNVGTVTAPTPYGGGQ